MTFKALKSSNGSIDLDHGYPILSKEESSIFEKYHTFCTKSNFQDIVDYCNEACRGLKDSFVDVAILDYKRSNFEVPITFSSYAYKNSGTAVKPDSL